MNILVLVKEVPDMEKVRFDSEKGRVDRSSAEAELNPFDENALQAALDLKERLLSEGTCKEVSVTVMTMGPAKAERTLKDTFARGADRTVLLTDRRFGGADTCATARTLAAAIKQTGKFELIFCGEKSVDGDTAQVGAEVAEFLDIPHSYYVEKIVSADEKAVNVAIENLAGEKQIRNMKLPALVAVTKNIAVPKLPTLVRKLESLKAPVEIFSFDDLTELEEEKAGLKGSPTKVAKIHIPPEQVRESRIFREDFREFAEIISSQMMDIGILSRSRKCHKESEEIEKTGEIGKEVRL